MRHANLSLKIAAFAALPFLMGAYTTSVTAQEPVVVDPPAQADVPPAHVLEPEPAPTAPNQMDAAGDAGADGTTQVVVPNTAQPAPPEPMDASATSPSTLTLADLVGKSVVDAQGKTVGLVTDVKMDGVGGVKELHVRTSGFFGFGAKTLVVPYNVVANTKPTVKLKIASAAVSKLAAVKAPRS